jgi:hypothetical protein
MNIKRAYAILPTKQRLWVPGAVAVVRSVFFSLLATLIALDLAVSVFKAGQFLRRSRPVSGISSLDSFSSSGTAVALLNQEAERLFADYIQARDDMSEDERALVLGPAQVRADSPEVSKPIGFPRFSKNLRGEASWFQPLVDLRATVRDLHLNLDQKLLLIYSENHLDDEFLNLFLQMFQGAPDCPEALEWVRCALDCSQHLHRTQEVEEAIRHQLRFHSELKTAAQLAFLLEEWETDRQQLSRSGN